MKSWRNVWMSVGFAALIASQSAVAMNVRMGALWDDYGTEGNFGWGGTAMVWPGGLWPAGEDAVVRERSSVSYKGFLYGVTDFIVPDTLNMGFTIPDALPPTEAGKPTTGDVLPFYVVVRDIPNHQGSSWNPDQLLKNGARGVQNQTRGMQVYLREALTDITVDGVAQSLLSAYTASVRDDTGGNVPNDPIIDGALSADVVVKTWWRNNMGMTTTRWVAQSLHEDHDDYFVWHYNFMNDGRYHQSDYTAQHTNTLNDFYYSWSVWFMDRDGGAQLENACCQWGGDNQTAYQAERRMMYGYSGDAIHVEGDDSGDPHPDTREMVSARWPGIAVIHADTSPTDRADDATQPRRMDGDNGHASAGPTTTGLVNSDPAGFEPLYKTMIWPNGTINGSTYQFAPSAAQLGIEVGDCTLGFACAEEALTIRYRAMNTTFTVGGWDIAAGEDINVTWIAAVGGLPVAEAIAMGAAEVAGTMTRADQVAKFMTLQDTLNMVVDNAIEALGGASSWTEMEVKLAAIAKPPGSPATLDIASGIVGDGGNKLTWTAPASGGVTSYRVSRAYDTPWDDGDWVILSEQEVHPLTLTSFTDALAEVGRDAYYRVTAAGSNGVWSSRFTGLTTIAVVNAEIPTAIAGGVPAASSLSNAAPNPFNPSTTFDLTVADAADARVDVYGITGQLVATLMNEIATVGVHHLIWDGRDSAGRLVASGPYMVRAQVGEKVFIQRVTFLR